MQQCERHGAAATRRMRGADPFLGSVERCTHVVRRGTEAHCMMKVSSAPRGRWGRTWFLSLPLSRTPALSRPSPRSSLAARSLARALSPPTPSDRTHAAATRAAPMTLPRLPLLLLARTYSAARVTRGNVTADRRFRRLRPPPMRMQ